MHYGPWKIKFRKILINNRDKKRTEKYERRAAIMRKIVKIREKKLKTIHKLRSVKAGKGRSMVILTPCIFLINLCNFAIQNIDSKKPRKIARRNIWTFP